LPHSRWGVWPGATPPPQAGRSTSASAAPPHAANHQHRRPFRTARHAGAGDAPARHATCAARPAKEVIPCGPCSRME
jgi:hypothetical protein